MSYTTEISSYCQRFLHTTWTPEDEKLYHGVDRQQQAAVDVFIDDIVALGVSLDQGDRTINRPAPLTLVY